MNGGISARLAFYPTLLFNVMMKRITNRNWYDRIDSTLIVGALPFRETARELAEKENVCGVISLNEPYELKRFVTTQEEWEKLGVETLYLPTVDLVAAPSQADLVRGVEFIKKHADANQSVYVHCKAGRTRSATLAACFLIKNYGWTSEKAVDFLMEKRPHIWLRQEQLSAIEFFCQVHWKPGSGSKV